MKEIKDLLEQILSRDDLVIIPPEPEKKYIEVDMGNDPKYVTFTSTGSSVIWTDYEEMTTASSTYYTIKTERKEEDYEESEKERVNRETALESKNAISIIKNKKTNYANRSKGNRMERCMVKTRSLPRNRHRMVTK